jgi:uncharacterized protein YycO
MRLLFSHGNDLISRLIRWQTRGDYSHVAIELENATIIEAWHKGGVLHHPDAAAFAKIHPGAIVTPFTIRDISSKKMTKARNFLLGEVGKPYDFRAVFRFVSRVPATKNNRWFCSELAAAAFAHAGMPLLHQEPEHISPRDLAMSPFLCRDNTISP